MSFFEVLMIGVGLSMDAFAASVCKGLSMRRASAENILLIGVFFGGFQALMPLIGYFLGKQFEDYIVSVDHWIAFVLLGLIGVNMIRESRSTEEEEMETSFALLAFIGGKMIADVVRDGGEEESAVKEDRLRLREILMLALATSIDALAVGISFAFLKVEIISAVATIGVTTLLLSALGVVIGHRFGARYKNKATLAGGVILILIGTKILLEHLGIIA